MSPSSLTGGMHYTKTPPSHFSVRIASSTIKTKHKSILANCSTDPAVAANKRGRAIHSFPYIRAQHIALLRETWQHTTGARSTQLGMISMWLMRVSCLLSKVLFKCAYLSRLLLFGNLTPGLSPHWFKSLLRQRNHLYHRGQVAKADTLSLKIGKIINAVPVG